MAELTIAQLTELLAANVDNADLLPIWDDTASETKKITISNFRTAVGVSNWSESFSSTTQATSRWIPNNAATNVNAAIVPKGNGAIVAAIPDGTTTGGDARGIYVVDLQMQRTASNQVASSSYSVIGGGYRNRITGQFTTYSTISGGDNNLVSAVNGNHVISGGSGNQILNDNNEGNCVIGGGLDNQLRSGFSVIGGGRFNDTNTASQYYQTIGGGFTNNTSSGGATISGGQNNTASGASSTIGGGQSNTASATHTTVGGGQSNTASAAHSFVGGGQTNTASGTWSFIGGGQLNASAGYYNVIGGGFTNSGTANAAVTTQSTTTTSGTTAATLSGANASIKVGQYITGTGIASDTYVAAISGTSLTLSKNASGSGTNTLSFFTPHGVVVGGGNNQATGLYSFIGGGGNAGTAANRNVASGDWSVVVGGTQNLASNTYTFVGGGINNRATNLYSSVVGGINNSCGDRNGGFIGGGDGNSIGNNRSCAILGGNGNSIGGGDIRSSIAGGFLNSLATSEQCFVGGGQENTCNGNAFIVGGFQNTAGSFSGRNFIGAGNNNVANASGSNVVGGSTNAANGAFSAILGGANSVANLYGQQSYASGRFSANGDAQAHELIWRREITGTATTELFLDGASVAAILPSTNSVWHGIIDISSICTAQGNGTTVTGDVAATSYKVTIKRIGTTTSLVGTVQEIGSLNSNVSMAAVAFIITNNDTNESLQIAFTPPPTAGSTTTIRVMATFRGTQIKY